MKGNQVDYLEFAQSVTDRAAARGVEAEVYIQVGQETQILVDRGQVEKLSRAGSKGMGLRVIRNGQMGYAYTSDFGDASVEQTIVDAIDLADVVDEDEHRTLPDPHTIPDADLAIYDPDLATLSTEEKIQMAMLIERTALDYDERIFVTNRAMVFDAVATVYLVNSKGFSGSYGKTMIAGTVMAMARDETDRSTGFAFDFGSRLADFDPASIGKEAARKAVQMLGGKPVPTQRATVVYSPLAAASIAGALSRALTGEAMQRNRSFLQGKMGQTVASDRVSLLDNGRLPGGLGTRPFDGEGIPTSATRLIDEGVLQAVLFDSYSASRDGTASSTGNAGRSSHRSVPALAATNFYFQPGHESPEEVIAGVERGLYVEQVMNTASINPVSGDYSVSAKGFWIEDGQLRHPVNEVTIALPLAELLQNVGAVANDLTFVPFMGALGSPTLRVDGVMIGGSGESHAD